MMLAQANIEAAMAPKRKYGDEVRDLAHSLFGLGLKPVAIESAMRSMLPAASVPSIHLVKAWAAEFARADTKDPGQPWDPLVASPDELAAIAPVVAEMVVLAGGNVDAAWPSVDLARWIGKIARAYRRAMEPWAVYAMAARASAAERDSALVSGLRLEYLLIAAGEEERYLRFLARGVHRGLLSHYADIDPPVRNEMIEGWLELRDQDGRTATDTGNGPV